MKVREYEIVSGGEGVFKEYFAETEEEQALLDRLERKGKLQTVEFPRPEVLDMPDDFVPDDD